MRRRNCVSPNHLISGDLKPLAFKMSLAWRAIFSGSEPTMGCSPAYVVKRSKFATKDVAIRVKRRHPQKKLPPQHTTAQPRGISDNDNGATLVSLSANATAAPAAASRKEGYWSCALRNWL